MTLEGAALVARYLSCYEPAVGVGKGEAAACLAPVAGGAVVEGEGASLRVIAWKRARIVRRELCSYDALGARPGGRLDYSALNPDQGNREHCGQNDRPDRSHGSSQGWLGTWRLSAISL